MPARRRTVSAASPGASSSWSPRSRSHGWRGSRRTSPGTGTSRRRGDRVHGTADGRGCRREELAGRTAIPLGAVRADLRAAEARDDRRGGREIPRDTEVSTGTASRRRSRRTGKKGRVVAGGSTITQQLAKNLFLAPTQAIGARPEEAVVTVLLEAMLSEAAHLRTLPQRDRMGRRRVRRRSRRAAVLWRGGAAQLSAEQAARLAAMTPSPRVFERRPDSSYLDGRVATILARMPGAVVP